MDDLVPIIRRRAAYSGAAANAVDVGKHIAIASKQQALCNNSFIACIEMMFEQHEECEPKMSAHKSLQVLVGKISACAPPIGDLQ